MLSDAAQLLPASAHSCEQGLSALIKSRQLLKGIFFFFFYDPYLKIIYPLRMATAFPLLPSSQKGRTAGPFGNRPGAADGGDVPLPLPAAMHSTGSTRPKRTPKKSR